MCVFHVPVTHGENGDTCHRVVVGSVRDRFPGTWNNANGMMHRRMLLVTGPRKWKDTTVYAMLKFSLPDVYREYQRSGYTM